MSLQGGGRRAVSVLGEIIDVKISSDETSGALAVAEVTAFPQNGPPPHIHHREDESFYVLEGKFSFLVADRMIDVPPGSMLRVPKGTLHTYQNVGTEAGKLLTILTPGGFEKFFLEVGQPVSEQHERKPPDPETIMKLMTAAPKYGLEVKLS